MNFLTGANPLSPAEWEAFWHTSRGWLPASVPSFSERDLEWSVLIGAFICPLVLPLTAFPGRLLAPRCLGRIRKKMLEDELYLLIQRPMFTFGKGRQLILEPLPNSEQQSSLAFPRLPAAARWRGLRRAQLRAAQGAVGQAS